MVGDRKDMLNVNNSSSTPYVNNSYGTQNTSQTTPTAGTNNPAGYKTDGYTSSTSYSTLGSGTNSFPVSQIISENPTIASKFSKFFIGNSGSLLRVGSTSVGRFFLNMMAGNVPFLTSKTVSTQISNSINVWVGRSDLVRTGMNPIEATLLQEAGIKNVTDLSMISNPSDQSVLAQMVNAAGAAKGIPVMITQPQVAGWVSAAQQLPKYL